MNPAKARPDTRSGNPDMTGDARYAYLPPN